MSLKFFRATAIALSLGAVGAPAFAHHSIALFDNSKTVTLKGTVSEFRWINPHVLLLVEASADGDAQQLWTLELANPGTLTRNGWTKRSFNPGDAVVVEIGPLRDGKPGGFFKKATLTQTGQVLTFKLQP